MKIRPEILVALMATGSLRAEIVINEIHYNSRPNDARDEFIELHNTGAGVVDLGGWFFNDGVDYIFPAGSEIEAGGFVVVAQNPAALRDRFGVSALGPFDGGLSGEGETVELRQPNGQVAGTVSYSDHFPWPTGAGGAGSSMELINPELDNDLGGSWRSSQIVALPELTLIPESADGWRWRRGTSEASSPLNAWTAEDFAEDGTWMTQALPIGYGIVGTMVFDPPITEMRNDHTSIFLRREFEVAAGEIPPKLLLRYLLDDGFVISINGQEVFRTDNLNVGQLTIGETANRSGNENEWQETEFTSAVAQLQEGTNVIAIHAFNSSLRSSDFGVNVELIRPEPDRSAPPQPSPGIGNTVFSEVAPPAIRQVDHSPKKPKAGETVVITAKVTDPEGVAAVTLEAQDVAPGAYVPAFLAKSTSGLLSNPTGPRTPNPAYEQNWTMHAMLDDGVGVDEVAKDGIYTVTLASRPNRTLVRYRITVEDSEGAEVRVPYADDERLNFGYFQYDGVPDFETTAGTFSAETLESVPVYHVLTTAANFNQAVAYNSGDRIPSNNFDARSEYNWSCTFVYDGEVYDNARYRLRQRNARYSGNGKRSLKFRFNRGNYPTFRDRDGEKYPQPWKFLATHKMIGSRSNSTWGMDQATNHLMWNLTGTPAPFTHWAHLRVVQGADEATSQFQGDYYGMLLALEEYDSRFLDSHKLEKGNLYKLISYRTNGLDVQRYQAAGAVNDGSDFSTIIRQLNPAKDDTWLREHVNWESWNHYHAVVDMIRHYDVQPNIAEHLKNRAYYFEPSATNPLGRLNVLPWDSDTSWGPNWNGGVDFPKRAIFGTTGNTPREPFSIDYLNTVRELRDLVWTPEQIDLMIDPLAEKIEDLVPADQARWRGAPGGGQLDLPLDRVVSGMKKFAFTGGSWVGGTNGLMPSISDDAGLSGREGRDAYLDALVADSALPAMPSLTYSGAAGFPQDGLAFNSTPFSDPQGAGTFQAMEWRLAEIISLGGGFREIMPKGRVWSYLDNNVDQGTAWREVGFDDSGWSLGAAPAGFGIITGLPVFGTTIGRGISTGYFRTTVNVTDLDLIAGFIFSLLVDDGVVVYVNGQEAFREGFADGTNVIHSSLAESNGNESVFDDFEVSTNLFVEGANVVAIEVHNRSLRSSDLGFEMSVGARELVLPPGETPAFEWDSIWESGELMTFAETVDVPPATKVGRTYRARVRHQDDTGRWSNWSEPVEFVAGAPSIQPYLDNLVISKMMYHPVPPSETELALLPTVGEQDFEWVEIMNIGSEGLDLSELRFTKGIEFDFVEGSKMTIAPGERLVIVANEEAFNLRHGYAETPDFVIGEFSKSLSNGGERVKLSFGAGTLVREVEYNDKFPWPDAVDGSGASLVLVDGFGADAGNWRPSVGTNGSPGADDGLPFSGDLTAYALMGALDIELVEIEGVRFAELSFDRRVNADATRIVLQSADALNDWALAAASKVAEVFGPGVRSRVTYRSDLPVVQGKDFYRLKIELK
jgi:hypothetical protein